MTTKITAKSTRETLEDRLKDDGGLLKDAAALVAFGSAIAAGGPLGVAAGVAVILKTAGHVITAGTSISKRLSASEGKSSHHHLQSYDRFRVIFYIACQRCYIESLVESLERVRFEEPNTHKKLGASERLADATRFRERIAMLVAKTEEAEVSYLFCVDPLQDETPLFAAYDELVASALESYGADPSSIRSALTSTAPNARKRFQVYISSDSSEAKWIANYLAITRDKRVSKKISTDLSSIRATLDDWVAVISDEQSRTKEAWQAYRKELKELPSRKDTMFGEAFGVNKVFLTPEVTYQVIGFGTGKHVKTGLNPVANLGKLFGALLSGRLSGEELIILCGGPGSGKSTLCRVLAAELAKNPNVHPVFLRLRRLREGSDLGQFIEESLTKQGLISRLSDLRAVHNLILILDGFDELVMASRAKLRHFFNLLKEELSSGPLRHAKAVVSGRDTLFPGGEGLPSGSHVLSLLPFDAPRVASWGEKWRLLHAKNEQHPFHPEVFLQKQDFRRTPPLHHLVSWPLTLHLVARVHAAGHLQMVGKKTEEVEKAYLYRSILGETAARQLQQTEGDGRLNPKEMRFFLRELAWTMYLKATDSMDPTDVVELLKLLHPGKSEADLAELADVAVVNSPELTKGEETGFEFVHKSFAEYLVGERLADRIDRVAFKIFDYGETAEGERSLSWRMSDEEAIGELSLMIGVRLLTDEVQEMLEPMLGDFLQFSKGNTVSESTGSKTRSEGLQRVQHRCEQLYARFLKGELHGAVDRRTRESSLVLSPLEALANYCAGLMMLGAAAAKQRRSGKESPQMEFFRAEPFDGAFWRAVCIIHAGGIVVNTPLAARLFDHATVKRGEDSAVGDLSLPLRPAILSRVAGWRSALPPVVSALSIWMAVLQALSQLGIASAVSGLGPDTQLSWRHLQTRFEHIFDHSRFFMHEWGSGSDAYIRVLVEGGFLPMEQLELLDRRARRWSMSGMAQAENPIGQLRRYLQELGASIVSHQRNARESELGHRLIDLARMQLDARDGPRFEEWLIKLLEILR